MGIIVKDPMAGVNQDSAEKLILYLCQKLEDSPGFGSVVLAKALYYSDHIHYVRTGQTITGFDYIKQKNGPTPKPAQFFTVRDSLTESGRAKEVEQDYYGYTQKRLKCLAPIDEQELSRQSASSANKAIEILCKLNSTGASEMSHRMGWELAALMEPLPHYTYLLTSADIDDEDIKWAEGKIKEYAATPSVH